MDLRQVKPTRAPSRIVRGSFKSRVAMRMAIPRGTSTVNDELRVCVSRKYFAVHTGKKYGASGTMLPMMRGTVWRNLDRRSGRIAAGCAKLNGITREDSQISAVTRNSLAPRLSPPGIQGPVLTGPLPVSTGPHGTLTSATNAVSRGRLSSANPAVALLAIHAGALTVLRPLDATLFTGANMSLGRRVRFLPVNV